MRFFGDLGVVLLFMIGLEFSLTLAVEAEIVPRHVSQSGHRTFDLVVNPCSSDGTKQSVAWLAGASLLLSLRMRTRYVVWLSISRTM